MRRKFTLPNRTHECIGAAAHMAYCICEIKGVAFYAARCSALQQKWRGKFHLSTGSIQALD